MTKKITFILCLFIALCIKTTATQLTDIDISHADDATLLETTITGLTSPARIILKPGFTYDFTEVTNVSYNLHIDGGTGDMPTLNIKNFDIADGSHLELLQITNCNIVGLDASADYLLNISTNCTVTDILFNVCRIKDLRGGIRLKGSGTIQITNLTISDCFIDNFGSGNNGYGLLNIDNANATIINTHLEKSTLTNIDKLFLSPKSTTDMGSLTISDCTFNNNLKSGKYIVDNKVSNELTTNYTNGVSVNNCIFGKTLESNNKGVIRVGTQTTTTYTNCYTTAEADGYMILQTTADGIISYSHPVDDLFTDIIAANYLIKDATFAGVDTAGDPRWRPGEQTNIDHEESAVETLITNSNIKYSEQMVQVNIYSITGHIVKSSANTSNISYHHLNKGVYIIAAKDQNGLMKIQKVVK